MESYQTCIKLSVNICHSFLKTVSPISKEENVKFMSSIVVKYNTDTYNCLNGRSVYVNGIEQYKRNKRKVKSIS